MIPLLIVGGIVLVVCADVWLCRYALRRSELRPDEWTQEGNVR